MPSKKRPADFLKPNVDSKKPKIEKPMWQTIAECLVETDAEGQWNNMARRYKKGVEEYQYYIDLNSLAHKIDEPHLRVVGENQDYRIDNMEDATAILAKTRDVFEHYRCRGFNEETLQVDNSTPANIIIYFNCSSNEADRILNQLDKQITAAKHKNRKKEISDSDSKDSDGDEAMSAVSFGKFFRSNKPNTNAAAAPGAVGAARPAPQ
jgi:hypothetical protein